MKFKITPSKHLYTIDSKLIFFPENMSLIKDVLQTALERSWGGV